MSFCNVALLVDIDVLGSRHFPCNQNQVWSEMMLLWCYMQAWQEEGASHDKYEEES